MKRALLLGVTVLLLAGRAWAIPGWASGNIPQDEMDGGGGGHIPPLAVVLGVAAAAWGGWNTHQTGGTLREILQSTWLAGSMGFMIGLPVSCALT